MAFSLQGHIDNGRLWCARIMLTGCSDTGKRLVNLQTDLHILNRYDGYSVSQLDEYEREPFHHPGVDLLPRLTVETRANLTHRARLATFASKQGVPGVLRWKPRIVSLPYLQACEIRVNTDGRWHSRRICGLPASIKH